MSGPRDFEKEIARLRGKMNQVFSDASMEIERPELLDEVEWVPSVDVLENKDEILVIADIPGMSADEIDLSILGDALQIRGKRKREVERDDENYHSIERGYGKFDRRVALPTQVNVDGITASYRMGVLTVRLSKLEEKRAGKIKVGLE